MIRASYSDKAFITQLLVDSFYENASVNYIIKQDTRKEQRIKGLMNYSFDVCYLFGEIFHSEDKKGCALILFPEKRKKSFQSFLLDLQFIFSVLDVPHFRKALLRESKLKARQKPVSHYYLWFIGVSPEEQGKGIGTKLLEEVLKDARTMGRPVLLETSNMENVRWYKKAGFTVYDKLDLGYLLYFMAYE